jgi:hypothetical protein
VSDETPDNVIHVDFGKRVPAIVPNANSALLRQWSYDLRIMIIGRGLIRQACADVLYGLRANPTTLAVENKAVQLEIRQDILTAEQISLADFMIKTSRALTRTLERPVVASEQPRRGGYRYITYEVADLAS